MQKARYKVNNWPEYNNSLVNRYNITVWLNEEVVKHWRHKGHFTHGAPKQYSDLAIEIMLTFRSLLSLPLRGTEGFMRSVARQMSLDIPMPDYTTICRRQSSVKIKLPRRHISKKPVDIIIDSNRHQSLRRRRMESPHARIHQTPHMAQTSYRRRPCYRGHS